MSVNDIEKSITDESWEMSTVKEIPSALEYDCVELIFVSKKVRSSANPFKDIVESHREMVPTRLSGTDFPPTGTEPSHVI